MEKKLRNAFDYAISNGSIEMFDLLAKDFDKFDQEDKNSLLRRTIQCSPSTEFIQHVLNYGYDINFVDEDKNTLLHYAATSSYPATVRLFIQKGLDLEAKNKWDATPICEATCNTENPEVIQTLIDSGANMYATSHGGENLLISAAGINTNPEITKFLLKKGFDIEDTDDDGFTALLNAAAWQDNLDVIKVLLDAGANSKAKSKRGDNLLHHAAFNMSEKVANFISAAFFTSSVNNEGETCLEKALKYGYSSDVLKVFLKKMKEEHMFMACGNPKYEILETLIDSGYDPNTTDSDGMSVLMFASKINENPSVIRMLLCKNACLDARDFDGRNVVHYAAVNTNPKIYEWMKEDSDFEHLLNKKDCNGKTPEYYHEHMDEF